MDKIKLAIVGAGIWGENHAQAFSFYHPADLVCICDLDEERAKGLADKYRCDYTTDINEIANGDIDAVSIATPDHAHHAPAITVIEAGKHVLVEKPLTTDVAEAKEIIAAAKNKGVKLMVDYQLRWNPAIMGAKAYMENGELGKPVVGYARLSDTIYVPTQMLSWGSNSGPEWFLFPHTMDAIRWITQEEPSEVYAKGIKRVLKAKGIDAYDAIHAMVTFENCVVTFESSWVVPESYPSVVDAKMTLVGDKGRVNLNLDYAGLDVCTDRFHYPFGSHGITRYGKPFGFHYESIKYFVDCILEDKEPEATGQDGLVATAMITAAMKSIEENRIVKMAEIL